MKKALALILSAPLLSACGGGSSDDSSSGGTAPTVPSTSVETSPLRFFDDGEGGGVAEYRVVSGDGETQEGFVVSGGLLDALRGVEQALEESVSGTPPLFEVSGSLPIVSTGAYTIIRQGAAAGAGVSVNATLVSTLDEETVLLIGQSTDGDLFLISAGESADFLPAGGTGTYRGTLSMQDVYFDPAAELGDFTATANFQTGTVNFDGSTASYRASGTATVSGSSFASGTMTIEDQPFSIVETGSLRGNFHGSGGNGMAGVIYSNDGLATYRGGFVGSR